MHQNHKIIFHILRNDYENVHKTEQDRQHTYNNAAQWRVHVLFAPPTLP